MPRLQLSAGLLQAALLVAGLCGSLMSCGPQQNGAFDPAQSLLCGGDLMGPPVLTIVNGSTSPPINELSAAEQMAIATLSRGDAGPVCTATVINEFWAISANHCFFPRGTTAPNAVVDPADYAGASLTLSPASDGRRSDPGSVSVPIARIYPAPYIIDLARQLNLSINEPDGSAVTDIALLRLAVSAVAPETGLPQMVPIQLTKRRIPKDILDGGRRFPVAVAGYGATDPDFGGISDRRLYATIEMNFVRNSLFTTAGKGASGVCGGDSGGPMLVLEEGDPMNTGALPEAPRVRLVGTLWGSILAGDKCVNVDNWSRVDIYHEAILTLTGPTGVGGESQCAEEGQTRCAREDGGRGTLLRCTGGTLERVACATTQRPQGVCGLVAPNTWDCVSSPAEDLCGGLRPWGRCDAQVSEWCDADEARVKRRDCSECGQSCAFSKRYAAYYCG